MSDKPVYSRYAVYFAPRPETALGQLGQSWLGVNTETGEKSAAPSDFIASPRRYGFHATLKAPLRLAKDRDEHDFLDAVKQLSKLLKPVELGLLKPRKLGKFLSLMQSDKHHDEISNLVWSCVRSLDQLRAPLTPEDIARRPNLKGEEQENMLQWGYPYVADQFRFHMTLTSQLTDAELIQAEQQFVDFAGDVLEEPVTVDALSVFGDPGAPGSFRLVERFDLKG